MILVPARKSQNHFPSTVDVIGSFFELAHWATHPWNPRLDMRISYNPEPQLRLKLFKSQASSSHDHLFSELISTCRPL
jgi:hypothetical protein